MDDSAQTSKALRFRGHPVTWADLDPIQIRQHLAAHEAGHAVVGLRYGMAFLDIDIQSDPVAHPDGGFIFGGVRFVAPHDDMNEWADAHPAEAAVVLMAGFCAEEVLLRCHLRESWEGDVRIMRIGHGWLVGMADHVPEMFGYVNAAHEAVTQNQTVIRDVANVLLARGRMTANEVEALI
jgi:hypothetical protein